MKGKRKMKRLKWIIYLIFIILIIFTGCEKKPEAALNPEPVVQIIDNLVKQEEQLSSQQAEEPLAPLSDSNNTDTKNINKNEQADKTQNTYQKYLGYWQLENRDLKYNDVVRGFSIPLEISSIKDNALIGSLSFRMNDSYHINPGCTLRIQGEIKDKQVHFDFEEIAFGTGYGIITLKEGSIEVEIKLSKHNENAPFSIEGSSIYKKIPEKNLHITTTPKKLISYLGFNKKEMLRELGKDYQIVATDSGTPLQTGYFYPQYELTFEFEDAKESYVSRILCGETIEVNGAKTGMNFQQIKQYMGNAVVTEVIDARIPEKEVKSYQLLYKIYDTIIRFDSTNEAGEGAILSISKS